MIDWDGRNLQFAARKDGHGVSEKRERGKRQLMRAIGNTPPKQWAEWEKNHTAWEEAQKKEADGKA